MRLNHSSSTNIILALFSFLLVALFASTSLAFDPKKDLRNKQTYDLMQQDKLILVDVRTKQEWQQSGIAKGAITISMLDRGFLERIAQIRLDNPDKIIAFICASGRRSSIVQRELVKRGYDRVFSVFGGTTGNGIDGWIKDGLPIEKYSEN